MVQTILDPKAEFDAEAEKAATALATYTRRIHQGVSLKGSTEQWDPVRAALSPDEQEAAIERVRNMLALCIAIKYEKPEGVKFEGHDDALAKGLEILDFHAAEPETLEV